MGEDLGAAVCGLAPEKKGKEEIRKRRFSARAAEARDASLLAILRKRSSFLWISSRLEALPSSCAP